MCGRYALEEAGITDAYLVLLRLLGKALQANRRGTSAEPAAVAASRQRRRRRGGGCAGAGARDKRLFGADLVDAAAHVAHQHALVQLEGPRPTLIACFTRRRHAGGPSGLLSTPRMRQFE
jgi:hypothetical protein